MPNLRPANTTAIWSENSSIGATRYLPQSTLGPRIQAYVQLVFVYEGSMCIQRSAKEIRVKAGQTALLLPGKKEYFKFSRTTDTFHAYVHINPKSLTQEKQQRLNYLARVIPFSKTMEKLIQEAVDLDNLILSTKHEILESVAHQLLWHYVADAEALGLDTDSDAYQRVPKSQRYIHNHLAEELSLAGIAKVTGVSKNQLIRLFKQELGMTPMTYVWQRRTEVAIESLKHSGLSIEEITERCGFASRYHLSRRVKQQSGLSPAKLRRHYWRQQHSDFELKSL